MVRLLLLIVLLISFHGVADTSLPSSKITKIATGWSSGGLYFSLEGSIRAEGGHNAGVRIPSSHPMLNEILALALSAYHANKPVVFRISGCIGNDMKGLAIDI